MVASGRQGPPHKLQRLEIEEAIELSGLQKKIWKELRFPAEEFTMLRPFVSVNARLEGRARCVSPWTLLHAWLACAQHSAQFSTVKVSATRNIKIAGTAIVF